MGRCPFCASNIDENVLLYGGSCPKCFGEIPGEEAATDPGAIVRAKQARSDSRRTLFKTLIPLLLMAPMLGVLVIVALGFVIWNRDPVLEPIDLDQQFDGVSYDDNIIAAPPDADPDEKKPVPQPKIPNPGTHKPRPVGADTRPAPKPQTIDTKKGLGGLSGLGSALDDATNKERDGVALTDPEQIMRMVRRRIGQQQGQLQQCYSAALERNPQLFGRWKAHFVVQKSGRATEIEFKGRTMSDARMETCLSQTVAQWKFGKIAGTQQVMKSWKFGN